MPQIVGELGVNIVPLGLQQFKQTVDNALGGIGSNLNLNLNSSNFTRSLGTISRSADEFTRSLDASNARVLAFGASAGIIFGVERAIKSLVTSTIEVEKELAQVNVILHANTSELKNFGDALFETANNTGQTFKEAAEAATEFARQGLGLTETLKRTNDALILTRLSGQNTTDSIKAITVAVNGFNKSSLDSSEIINKLIAVDNAFAVSAKDLSEALTRVGSVAQDAGVSIDELNGLVTAAQQISGRGGAVIGNAIKSIFTRLERPQVLDQLAEIGIKVRSLEGDTLPAIEIFKNLAQSFSSLTQPQKEFIGQLSAGLFQINQFKAIVGDLAKTNGIFAQSSKISANATSEAITRSNELNDTFAATLNKTKNNLTKISADIGGLTLAPAIKNILSTINDVIDATSSQGDGIGSTLGKGILKGLGDFISGPGLALVTIVLAKLSANFAKFAFDATKNFTDLTGSLQQQKALQTEIQELLLRNPEIQAALNQGLISQTEAQAKIIVDLEREVVLRAEIVKLASSTAFVAVEAGFLPKTGFPKAALGFVPSYGFDEVREKIDAQQGGYAAGIIKETVIPGVGKVIYNSAETLKDFGLTQPAILPPERSMAGINYRKEFLNTHGFDPYKAEGKTLSAAGFVPGGFNPQTVIQLGQIGSVAEINNIIDKIARAGEGGDRAAGQLFAQLKRLANTIQLTADQYDFIYQQAIQAREAGLRQRGVNLEGQSVGGVGVLPQFRPPQETFNLSGNQNEFFSILSQSNREQEKRSLKNYAATISDSTPGDLAKKIEDDQKQIRNILFNTDRAMANIYDEVLNDVNKNLSQLKPNIISRSIAEIEKDNKINIPHPLDIIEEQRITALQNKGTSKRDFTNAALIGSIATPLIGGVLSEGIGQNFPQGSGTRGAQATASGAGNIVSFASTGFFLSGGDPLGAVAGGVLGLALELPKIFHAFTDVLPDLQKKFETTRSTIARTSEALSNYTNITDKLDAIYRGEVTASFGQIRNLQSQGNTELAKLNPQQQNRLTQALASGGIPKFNEVKAQINQQDSQKLIADDISLSIGLLNQNKGSQFFTPAPLNLAHGSAIIANEGSTLNDISQNPLDKFTRFNRLGKDLAIQDSNKLLSLQGEGGINLLDTFLADRSKSKDLFNTTPKDFLKTLQNSLSDIKVRPDLIADATAQIGKDPDALYLLTKTFQQRISSDSLDKIANQNTKFEDSSNRSKAALDSFSNKIFETILGLQHLNREVETNASSAKQNFGFQKELQTVQNQGFIANQSNFVGPQTVQALTFASNLAAIQQEQQINQKTAGVDLQKDLFNSLSTGLAAFLDADLKKAIALKGTADTTQGIELKGVDFVNKFIGGTQFSDQGTVSGISDLIKSISDQRNQLLDKGHLSLTDQTQLELLKKEEEDLSKVLDKYNETIRLGSEKAIQNQKLEEERNKIALTAIETQRKINFGGGISNILSPNNNFALDFLNARGASVLGRQTGNSVLEGSGALQQADLLQSLGADITAISPELKDTIIRGTAAKIDSNLRAASVGLTGTTSTAIATTQFENRFKTESQTQELNKNFSNFIKLQGDTNGFLISLAKSFGSTDGANVHVTNLGDIQKEVSKNFPNTSTNDILTRILEAFKLNSGLFGKNIPITTPSLDVGVKYTPLANLTPDARSISANLKDVGMILGIGLDKLTNAATTLFSKSFNGPGENRSLSDQYLATIPSPEGLGNQSIRPGSTLNRGFQDLLERAKQTTSSTSLPSSFIAQKKGPFDGFANLSEGVTGRNTQLTKQFADAQGNLAVLITSGTAFADEIAKARLEATNLGIALNQIKGSDIFKTAGVSFLDQLRYDSKDLFRDINNGAAEMGQNLKTSFSDAVKSLADGSKNVGDALRSFGVSFAQKVLNKTIDISTSELFGGLSSLAGNAGLGSSLTSFISSLGGKSQGGIIGYSSGGAVTGGSGTKDDVQALLTSGEYVLKAPAVDQIKQTYGGGFLKQLNEGLDVSLANRYDFNDPLYPTAGTRTFDPTLSSFAFEDTNDPQTAIRNTKEALLVQYLKDKDAYNNNVEDALRAFQQAKDNRLIGAAISAAVGIGGAGLSTAFKVPTTGTTSVSNTSLPDWNTVAAGQSYSQNYQSNLYNAHSMGGIISYYAGGGKVGSSQYTFGGQDSRDTIPAMLEKGEWVIREPVVRKLGKSFFDNLNRTGKISHFADGGSVGNIGFGSSSNDITDHLLEQINLLKTISNSLINKTNSVSQGAASTINVSVVTNIASDGKVSNSTTSTTSSNQNSNSNNTDNVQKSKAFSQLMKNVAIQTIIENQRPGGLLFR